MASNTISILIKAVDDASKVLKNVGDELDRTADRQGRFQKALTATGAAAARVGAVGLAALATGSVLASKAAWEQVDAVQQATVALGAYEKSGDKVNKVLSDLVKYARSDMGVLFQRQDLFAAAQGLKIMGDNTGDLVDHVKIMSRSVGLGLSTFEGLGNVIQRVGATGKLYANDLQFLQNAGFRLDSSLSGTTQTFETLFALLDKGIPAGAMAGQADTIKGKLVKLQSSFRDVGLEILGVDKQTSQFIEGGLGDRLISGLDNARGLLKNLAPAFGDVTTYVLDLMDSLGELGTKVAEYLGPKFEALWVSIRDNLIPMMNDLWHNVIEPLLPVLGSLLVGVIGLVVDALKIMVDGLGFIYDKIKEGDPIMWGLIGVFGSLATAMGFNAVFNALTIGFHTLQLITIPSVMASIGALQALILAPLVMPAIAVGAALAALALVYNAAMKTKEAVENAAQAQDAANVSNADAIRRIQSSNQSVAWKRQKIQEISNGGRAMGGPVAQGQSYVVGERGPEIFTPSTSGNINPNTSPSQVIVNITGPVSFQNRADIDYFADRIDKVQRLARAGMA